MIRISIDMETASSERNAAILSLGAVVFDGVQVREDLTFYEKATLESNEELGLAVSRETMEWWDKQDPAVRAEVFSGKWTIKELLERFTKFCELVSDGDLSKIELWSRGAGFDCEILKNAYTEIFDGVYPFDFRKHMCQRTVQALMPARLLDYVAPNTETHNALADAVYQANVLNTALYSIAWANEDGVR